MSKVKFLDGLRGICCFIVLIDHSINTLKQDIRFTDMPGIDGYIRKIIALSPLNIIYSGISSVCIFFILSGFVLSIKYNKTRDDRLLFEGAIKRYPRLMIPVLSSMIFMYLTFLISNSLSGTTFNLPFLSAIYQGLYLSAFTHTPLDNYPLWSISFEMLGSLLLFSALSLFSRENKKTLLMLALFVFLYFSNSFYCLFVAGSLFCIHKESKYLNPNKVTKLIIFIAGIFIISTPLPRPDVQLYSGLYSYLKITKGIPYRELYDFLMMTGSIMIFYAIINSKIAERILSMRSILFLGKISFPLYLTHATILTIASSIYFLYGIEQSMINYLVTMLLVIPVCVTVSLVFERFIDAPAVRLSSKIANAIMVRK